MMGQNAFAAPLRELTALPGPIARFVEAKNGEGEWKRIGRETGKGTKGKERKGKERKKGGVEFRGLCHWL